MAGNANSGRKRNQLISDALLVEIKSREKKGDKAGLRLMSVKVMDLAEAGEKWAVEYVRDTIEGKPMQRTELTGADGEDFKVVHRIELVAPGSK